MRKVWDIPGGIHPPENKAQSLTQGITSLPLPERLVLPLNQHIGAAAKPLIEVGDHVLKGQLLAAPVGLISAAVHAPTSGAIEAIEDRPIPHPSGMNATCIVLAPDGEDRWNSRQGLQNYLAAPPDQLLAKVRDAGITGKGGAGFPAYVKLGSKEAIDTLIINGTECEPYITADDILMRERPGDILQGVKILARILGDPNTILIGIEDNKPEAIKALKEAAEDTQIEVVSFPTKYPSGGEKQLIQILTGKEVPSGKLPSDLGIICQNVGTAYAIYRAVAEGEPLISRITTVTGKACGINRNYEVLLGTPIKDLLSYSQFDSATCARLVMGGPMMGFSLTDDSVPVIKTTNCILACNGQEAPPLAPQQPCIRCSFCVQACPASLLPQQLYWYSQIEDYERARNYNLFDCIECGACSYVCPSNIPLVQYYRAAKGEIRRLDAEKRKSDHARRRFISHQSRLERLEEEKLSKRESRRRATEPSQSMASGTETTVPTSAADDLIQAAMARAAARQATPEQQKAKLERSLEAAKHRLQFAREKLAAASGDTEQLQVMVDEAELKLKEAERKLARFADADQAVDGSLTTPKIGEEGPETSGIPIDAATAAIARAQARAKSLEEMSPEAKEDAHIDGLKARILKAQNKLSLAREENSEHLAALEAGLEKLEAKLQEALETRRQRLGHPENSE